MEKIPSIPAAFQALLWSADLSKLDLQKHRRYIIHQLLNYSDLNAFLWLKKTYSLPILQKTFINTPQRIYTDRSFSFVSTFLLQVDQNHLLKERYISMVS